MGLGSTIYTIYRGILISGGWNREVQGVEVEGLQSLLKSYLITQQILTVVNGLPGVLVLLNVEVVIDSE